MRAWPLAQGASGDDVQEKLMKDRDVEREVPRDRFVATLRRIADALEANDSFRIQVSGLRLTVPENAELSVEHEVDNNDHELELQLKWSE